MSGHGDRRDDARSPSSAAPAGVDFLDDLEETVVATVTAPTEVEEPEEIEEEAELVGEEGEVPRRPRARRAAEGDGRGAAEAAEAARSFLRLFRRLFRGGERRHGRLPVVGLGNPGDRYAGHAPQRRLRGRRQLAAERWELPKAKKRTAGC